MTYETKVLAHPYSGLVDTFRYISSLIEQNIHFTNAEAEKISSSNLSDPSKAEAMEILQNNYSITQNSLAKAIEYLQLTSLYLNHFNNAKPNQQPTADAPTDGSLRAGE